MDAATSRLSALLAPLTNYERQRPDRPRWSLDGMRALLAASQLPLPGCPLVQVGGSKGKGTTALYLESLAEASGLRTGTYMSPHLESMLERVRVGGRRCTEPELRAALEPIVEHAATHDLDITFFDAMTRAALSCFAAAGAEFGVLEVGLGGRLDSTTAVPVDASIVTSIELEHTEILGSTIEAVAAEKAWVLRPGRPGFTSATGAARAVLREHASRVGAELAMLGEDFGLEDVRTSEAGFAGTIRNLDGGRHRFVLRDAAEFELPALALAVACLARLRPERELALEPVARPHLPGRFERFTCADGIPLILDGAHTERSAQAVAAELDRRFPGQPLGLLFASAAGKRWQHGLKWLAEKADTVVVTALTDTRSEDPGAIVDWLRSRGVRAETAPSTTAGLQRLGKLSGVRVVTGSFYLVGEARSLLSILGVPTPA